MDLIRAIINEDTDLALEILRRGETDVGYIAGNDNTALILACDNKMSEVALELIATGQSKPEQVNINRKTALILACERRMKEVALAIIATGKSNPGQVNNSGNTALIKACDNWWDEVALAIIETGQSNPGHVNENNKTALIHACDNMMKEVIIELIHTGESRPEHVDNNGNTAILIACNMGMTEVALKLIETGQSNPGHTDSKRNTALMSACLTRMPEVALALIATGQSNPENVNKAGSTALLLSCNMKMSEVALALINTKQSKPGHVGTSVRQITLGQARPHETTALIMACENNMPEVALALIATGQSNPDFFDSYGKTAIDYATNNDMTDVIKSLSITVNINISTPSHNYIDGIDIPQISLYSGFTFIIDGVHASITLYQLKTILTTSSLHYNIGKIYVYMNSFSPIRGFILWNDLNELTAKFASRYYSLTNTGKNIKNANSPIYLYRLAAVIPTCNPTTNDSSAAAATAAATPEPVLANRIIIKYNNADYEINAQKEISYKQVIDYLKQEYPDIFAQLFDGNKLIRFMFNGRVFSGDNLDNIVFPGAHHLIVTKRGGTRGGRKKRIKTRKVLRRRR